MCILINVLKSNDKIQLYCVMLILVYCIRSNYRTYPYKRTVKQFRTLRITASVLFGYFFIGICCGYPFELHPLVDAIQMSTHNICFYKENQKKWHKHHLISSLLIFFLSVPFSRQIHILPQVFSSNFEKPKRTVR